MMLPVSLFSEDDDNLFNALRAKRKELAKCINVPAYFILTDNILNRNILIISTSYTDHLIY